MADKRLPPGHAPWVGANGFRIGALTGAAAGIGMAFFTGVGGFWFVVPSAAVGGLVGYKTANRWP